MPCNFSDLPGFSVDAVDISEAGLAEFAGKHPNIIAVYPDLDQFKIPADRYDLFVNVKFLNRQLFITVKL